MNALVAEHGERGASHYYLDDLALYYFMSRAFRNGVSGLAASRDSILSRISDKQLSDGSFGNELLTALALCTLINSVYADRETIIRAAYSLVRTQQWDGSWPVKAFYAGPEPPGPQLFWFGSEELTTALCLEALALYCLLA